MKIGDSGSHESIFEFTNMPDCINTFIDVCDNTLKKLNSDYEAKRYNNTTLKRPIIHITKSQLFYQ